MPGPMDFQRYGGTAQLGCVQATHNHERNTRTGGKRSAYLPYPRLPTSTATKSLTSKSRSENCQKARVYGRLFASQQR